MKLIELFDSESKWTKYRLARDKHGHPIPLTDERATCFCLLGAIDKCYEGLDVQTRIKDRLRDVATELGIGKSYSGNILHDPYDCSLSNTNDSISFEQLKEWVKLADV